MLTVRNLDPVVKEKLRRQAAGNGRSMEAEVREILAEAVRERPRTLVDIVFSHFGEVDYELEIPPRSKEMRRPVEF